MILIQIWSLVYGSPTIKILAVYIDFEGTKNIHVIWVLILGALDDTADSWILIWVWYLMALKMLKVPDWDLESWSWYGLGHWSLLHPWSKFWLSILILKVQRTSMSFRSWFGDLENARGSWLMFGILTLIWIWSLMFVTSMFQILAFYLDFEGAKNIHVL